MSDARVASGVVGEVTTVRRSPGSAEARGPSAPVVVGTVDLAGGGVVIARLTAGAVEGATVDVSEELGVAVARARSERCDD